MFQPADNPFKYSEITRNRPEVFRSCYHVPQVTHRLHGLFMATSHSLTERKLKAAAPPESGYILHWDDPKKGCPGFGARITSNGVTSFILQYSIHGRKRRHTIGRWPAWSVNAARDRAFTLYRMAQDGEDPQQARQDARAADKITLRSYLEDFYTLHQSRKASGDQTLAIIRNSFASLLNRPLIRISQEDIETWRARMEERGRQFPTIKRHYDALNGLINHAVKKTKKIDHNPLKGFSLDKPKSTAAQQLGKTTKRDMLTPEQTGQLFAGLEAFNELKRGQRARSRKAGKTHLPDLSEAAYCHPAAPFVRLAYYTGFRPGDLYGLHWEHIEFNQRRIRKVIEKTAAHNEDPQNFALSDAALQTLKDWREDQGKPKTGHVFNSERTGGRMDKHAMRAPWKKIKELGGLPADMDLYTLRHNFASQLIRAGVDIFAVSKLMAHTDIQTTINNYAKHAPEDAAEQVNKMPGANHA